MHRLESGAHHPSRVSCIASDYVLITIELGGFLSIAALLIGLFAWLRQDITRLGDRLSVVERGQAEIRERLARLEGLLEAITGRPVTQ